MRNEIWETYWADQKNHDWWCTPGSEVLDLIRTLSPEDQPKVLDIGCGLGRHAIAFALAGFTVTATDFSEKAVQYLQNWAESLSLKIETKVCDVIGDGFSEDHFDVVLSYNVIYHGLRADFYNAIRHAYDVLKPGGIFFFTCPSRQDGKYGIGEMVAPHTYKCTKSVVKGDTHYFTDESDLDELLQGFTLVKRWKSEGTWDNNGDPQFFSNWHILVKKPAADVMSRTVLLHEIGSKYQDLLSLLRNMRTESLTAPGVNGEWSIKDTLAHISAHEQRMLAWMTRRLRGETPAEVQPYAMPDAELDALNADIFQQNRSRSWEDVLDEWQNVHTQTLNFVESAGQALFDEQKGRLLEGEPLWLAVAANTCDHYEEHGRDIEAWLKSRAASAKEV